MKPRIGEMRYVEGLDGTYHPIIIASREVHNHREFYRAVGHGGMWLAFELEAELSRPERDRVWRP